MKTLTLESCEIWCNGKLHYRRPPGDKDVIEAQELIRSTLAAGFVPEYSVMRCGAEFMVPDDFPDDSDAALFAKFRLQLWRIWDSNLPVCMVIGMNPSTATHEVLDNTVKKCIKRAKREGCGALWMMNVFPVRETHSSNLRRITDLFGDRELADSRLVTVANFATIRIAAWGAPAKLFNRDAEVRRLLQNHTLHCFRLNADGTPMHPLYIPDDSPLILLRDGQE